jgi:S-DNA-T family DNA segregation ATPase FtsK/SpoIIIE
MGKMFFSWVILAAEMLLSVTLISTAPKKNPPLFVASNLIAIALISEAVGRSRKLEKVYFDVERQEDMLFTLKEVQAGEQLQRLETGAERKNHTEQADQDMLRQLTMLEKTAPIFSELFRATGQSGAIHKMALGMLQDGCSVGQVLQAMADAEMQFEQAKLTAQTQQKQAEIQAQAILQQNQSAVLPQQNNAKTISASATVIEEPTSAMKLQAAAKVVGINTNCIQVDKAPSYERLIFPVRTEDFALLSKWEKAAELALGQEDIPIRIHGSEQVAWEINVKPEDRVYLPFPANRNWKQGGRDLVLGWGLKGEVIVDLASEDTPQVLVVGTTGAGKSIFFRACIYSLLMQGAKVNICGGKVSDYEDFADRFPKEVISIDEMGKTLAIVSEYFVECDRRNSMNKEELNKQPSWILIIDEFKGTVPLDNNDRKLYDTQLSEVTRRGRGLKIHVIIGLQKGSLRTKEDPQGLPPDLRSNLPCRIAFRVAEAKDGRLILHRHGNTAVNLQGRGDGRVQSGLIDERFQAYNFQEIPA